jgi:hypothetical protein
MVEGCVEQVTTVEYGVPKIRFGEVHLPKRTVQKYGVIQFHLVEGGVIELTVFKAKRQAQLVAAVEPESQHFTLFKGCFVKGAGVHLYIAQVAPVKGAVRKPDPRKIGACKSAVPEAAVFIFPPGKRDFGVILFGKKLLLK